MEDNPRSKLLNFNQKQMEEVANACNRFPSITLDYKVINDKSDILSGEPILLNISLEREDEDYTELVTAPYFPKDKEEFWWVIVGDTGKNKLYGIKRINFGVKLSFNMKFIAPEPGSYNLTLILVCDSYLGCDEVCFITFVNYIV